MNDVALLTTIELCAGVGMLGEGLRAGLDYMGAETRAVCYVEREASAGAFLAARMEEGSLDGAPIWTDLTTFNARAFYGKVDCIVAGFPCQDLSLAGRRAGLDGKRSGLFFEVMRIATDSGAWSMLLENVAGIHSATASVVDEEEGELEERAAARVLGELADLGWDAEWITLPASDVGASHNRSRWFCWAWRMDILGHAGVHAGNAKHRQQPHQPASGIGESIQGCGDMGHPGLQHGDLQQRSNGAKHSRAMQPMANAERPQWGPQCVGGTCRQQGHHGHGREADCGAGVASEVLADSECGSDERRIEPGNMACAGCEIESQARQREWCGPSSDGCDCAVANPGEPGLQGHELSGACTCNGGGQEAHGSASQLCGLFAPGPSDPAWAAIIAAEPWRAPALSIEEEHNAKAAFQATESLLRGMADGLAQELDFDNRAARLRACGNGVVAAQCAAAVVQLIRRSGVRL